MSTELTVQYSKLAEWLLARRVIPDSYARLLPGLDSKVNEALSEPVADQAANQLISQYKEAMNYFAVKEIYDAVAKSPEGKEKSLLGAHTHPGAAKWKAAVDAFKKKNLGWINVSRILIQNVSYEIPALRKHAAACERQVQDCTQRQTELMRTEANAKSRHEKLLEELHIMGLDVKRELRQSAKEELPRLRSELVDLVKGSGNELLEYYSAFAAHAADGQKVAADQVLPMLRVVARDGQSAKIDEVEQEVPALRRLREQAARSAPARQPDPPAAVQKSAPAPADLAVTTEATGGGIDWGFEISSSGGGDGGGGGGGIQWDFEVTAGGTSNDSGGINWGIEATAGGETAPEPASAGGIDWGGISLEGIELGAQGNAEDEGNAATSDDQKDLLSDPHARELLYQDIAEVGSFLQARAAELAKSSTAEYGPRGVDKSLAEVKTLAGVMNRAEELMAGRKTQRLMMLESSDRYLEQQVKRVEISKSQCTKPVSRRAVLEKAKAEQLEEARRTHTELDKLRQSTRTLQRALEAELSAHFKATVRIVGDISQI